ncbi:hypothetical protein JCM33374_g1627 [Metschnikowia sp. JCM 33374]|nr:hypothetical protein JCM33374_g1627 [Metschnikowia sp. JCM 33374]
MAQHLLQARGVRPTPKLGQNWVRGFLKRHPGVFKGPGDLDRAQCETPEMYSDWFGRVQSTCSQHGILEDDIYSFDEVGFTMGPLTTTKAVTGVQLRNDPSMLGPQNSEWVTVIECASAAGFSVPPYIVIADKRLKKAWYKGKPTDWRLQVSDNGRTSQEIALFWLKEVFLPSTNGRTKGKHRLLLLDEQNDHLTPDFRDVCEANNIKVQCIPRHASSRLNPLDLVCFSVLKYSYNQLIHKQMRLGVADMGKLMFLDAYAQTREPAFNPDTIKSAFRATGLAPFDPELVKSSLPVIMTRKELIESQKAHSHHAMLKKMEDQVYSLLGNETKEIQDEMKPWFDKLVEFTHMAVDSSCFMAEKLKRVRQDEWLEEHEEEIAEDASFREKMPSFENVYEIFVRSPSNIQVVTDDDGEERRPRSGDQTSESAVQSPQSTGQTPRRKRRQRSVLDA